jgi:hypothetical protein
MKATLLAAQMNKTTDAEAIGKAATGPNMRLVARGSSKLSRVDTTPSKQLAHGSLLSSTDCRAESSVPGINNRRMMAWHRSNVASKRLDAIPNVSPGVSPALAPLSLRAVGDLGGCFDRHRIFRRQNAPLNCSIVVYVRTNKIRGVVGKAHLGCRRAKLVPRKQVTKYWRCVS